MTRLRWFRCTDAGCHCRWAPPTGSWGAPPDLHELSMVAMVRTVRAELGPAPGFSLREEAALIQALAERLAEAVFGEVVRACPWKAAREVLQGTRVVPLRPSGPAPPAGGAVWAA